MINRASAISRLNKIIDKLDSQDADINNQEILIFIKDVGDTDYYFIDDKGNKIPTSDAIVEHSIRDSKGKLIQPHIVNIEVVDNSNLESVLYNNRYR